MTDNKLGLIAKLRTLSLTPEEAQIYLELLREPSTHLKLSNITGISRTKVYRIIDQLHSRGLVAWRTDETGVFLAASDPENLEIDLITEEEKVKQKRTTLNELLPLLARIQNNDTTTFIVHTYEGFEGMKQMQWHELKTKGEVLVLGNVTVQELVGSYRWAEKHRAATAAVGYPTREIINIPYDEPTFTANQDFMALYQARSISKGLLPIDTPMIIYNDTVATYQCRNDKRVGVEIISSAFAQTMRHVFEHFWELATPNDARV